MFKLTEGVPFEWTFEMKRMNESAIRDHLVMPLLFNLTEKNARETELIEIIKNKDRLIDDFTRTQGIKSNLSWIFNLFYYYYLFIYFSSLFRTYQY